MQGDVGGGDARGAGAAVGLKDLAIDGEGVRADFGQVDGSAKGAADEALDFGAAGIGVADLRPGLSLGRGGGEHDIFGGNPPAGTLVVKPGRDVGGDGRGAEDNGISLLPKD